MNDLVHHNSNAYFMEVEWLDMVTPLRLKISDRSPCWELSHQLTKYPPGSDSGYLRHKVAILT